MIYSRVFIPCFFLRKNILFLYRACEVLGGNKMKLTILGSHGPYPGRDGACSGYLIDSDTTNILLDCGNGIISRYQRYHELNELRYIILTHLHSDHMSDMMVLRYAIDIMMKKGDINTPVNVYCPGTPEGILNELKYNNAFNINIVDENTSLSIGGIGITFEKMNHPVETYAVKMKKGGKTFVYSGDTQYTEKLVPFINNADIFLCDGNLLGNSNGPHLTAEQAALVAKQGVCKKLIITHLWPLNSTEDYYNEALNVFANVTIAKDFDTYVI